LHNPNFNCLIDPPTWQTHTAR